MTFQQPNSQKLTPGLYRIAGAMFTVHQIQAEGFEIEIIRLTGEPDKEGELYRPHPTNDQPIERSWYVEEYLVEPEDELGF